jgi:hypothetical protein
MVTAMCSSGMLQRRPQHEPGPAQSEAWPGLLPQHPVSWGPGRVWLSLPVKLLVGDMIFFVRRLPQWGQGMLVSLPMTSTSPVSLQALHTIS